MTGRQNRSYVDKQVIQPIGIEMMRLDVDPLSRALESQFSIVGYYAMISY